MQSPERISLVLRAPEGQSLEQILQFVQLGAPVAIGRGLAVITGAVDRDVVKPAIEAPEFSIDEHIRVIANANRYRWLRDGALGTGSANVPMVRIGMGEPVGGTNLDLVTDAAALNWPIVAELTNEALA